MHNVFFPYDSCAVLFFPIALSCILLSWSFENTWYERDAKFIFNVLETLGVGVSYAIHLNIRYAICYTVGK